jgi:2-polyprenyl-3-methyl-5-hydroxy-6-metoxy-1,4-benzoquinol methylase
MLDNTKKFWEESWMQHIEGYLNSVPRAGIFIKNYFKNIKSVLEIAGGSCRDSRYLANNGFCATGSDFDEKTLKYLQEERFPNDKLNYSKEDAFNLTFQDNSFDLVFHNGFFIYFNDDEIYAMLREQERVSQKYIVFFVHNKKNRKQVELFNKKAKNDKLYDIRFFNSDEVLDIVKSSGIKTKKLKILKFGGLYDVFYRKSVKKLPNILYPVRNMLIPRLYQFQKWEDTERICCVVELDI